MQCSILTFCSGPEKEFGQSNFWCLGAVVSTDDSVRGICESKGIHSDPVILRRLWSVRLPVEVAQRFPSPSSICGCRYPK